MPPETEAAAKPRPIYDPWAPAELERPAAADLMRVIATGAVGWYHIWQQSWVSGGALDRWPRSGAAMVDVLVMLSAFCLFLPYANAAAAHRELPAPGLKSFYLKRAARIMPSYYANLLASVIIRLVFYGGSLALLWDTAAHLTFTQMFYPPAYIGTQLNGVTWTLTVFALFYIVFPFLARAAFRAPVQTIAALLAVQWAWSAFVLTKAGTDSYQYLFNQFPAFCGVFAVGMLGAWALAYLGRRPALKTRSARVTFTLLALAAFYALDRLINLQSRADSYQRTQLVDRMPLVLAATAFMVCLALGVSLPFKRVWRWLAGISYNFYLWHQMLAVMLKYNLYLPAWQGSTPPNQLGDSAWMSKANLLYWAAGLAAAVLFTYAVERPAARWLKNKLGK